MEKAICKRCVTPKSVPGIQMDDSGVCSECRAFDRASSGWEATRLTRKNRLERYIEWAKRKHCTYDALIPLSGGKDSTYVLYLATKVYGLRVLCVTFDNGLQSDIARTNIGRALERSGADHVVVRPNRAMLMKTYAHFMKHVGMFCPVCMRGIYASTFALMRAFRFPLVLKGTSDRTEERLPPDIFQDGRYPFFRNLLAAHPCSFSTGLLTSDRSVLQRIRHGLSVFSDGRLWLGTVELQVPEYLDWDYDTIYSTVVDKFGWQPLPDRNEHVDCLMEPVAHYLRRMRVPDLTSSTLRYSAEIRSGQRTRETALEAIDAERTAERESDPRELDTFLDSIGISRDQLTAALAQPLRHMRYQGGSFPMQMARSVRDFFSHRAFLRSSSTSTRGRESAVS